MLNVIGIILQQNIIGRWNHLLVGSTLKYLCLLFNDMNFSD